MDEDRATNHGDSRVVASIDSHAGAVTVAATAGSSPSRDRLAMVLAGYRGDDAAAHAGLSDDQPSVRAAALVALARMGALKVRDVARGLREPNSVVRRSAADLAGNLDGLTASTPLERERVDSLLVHALEDPDPLVVDAACWALGERHGTVEATERSRSGEAAASPRASRRAALVPAAIRALCEVVEHHGDARCREAAVAALGAIGDPTALPSVRAALGDKAPVRRRAAVALAGFGSEGEQALRSCLNDRDWQVRQVAETLLDG